MRDDRPVRVGILDDCPFRRAAIRQVLLASRRYVVPVCAPALDAGQQRSRNLDGLLVAVHRKGPAGKPGKPRGTCSCRQPRGMVLGYTLRSFAQPSAPNGHRRGHDTFFGLPGQPRQFVTHLDRFFNRRAPHARDDRHRAPSSRVPLSARERAVFDLFGAGKEVKEVAAHLGVSPKTVYKFAERIRRKQGYATLHALLFAAARCRRRNGCNI